MIDIDELLYAINHPTEEQKRQRRREFYQILRSAKPKQCINCGEKVQLCHSHFVPRYVLKNIAVNGEVKSYFSLMESSALPEKYGLKNAGTFQAICHKCDQELFTEYETPENYNDIPTQKMLAQIVLKNYIQFVHKRRVDIVWGLYLLRNGNVSPKITHYFQNKRADLKRYEKCFINAKKRSLGLSDSKYHIIYFNKLPYVVPLAIQSAITIIHDFDGNVINNVDSDDSRYKLWELHVCIFPLNDSSAVLLFIDEKAQKRYDGFIQDFNSLSDNDKLSLIAYLSILYSEEIYFHPSIIDVIMNSKVLMHAVKNDTDQLILETKEGELYRGTAAKSIFSPERKESDNLRLFKDAPNLLSYEYRVKNSE